MGWTVILPEIFEICIIPLLGIVTYYLCQFIKAKADELTTEKNSEILNKYINMLSNTIIDCVMATNQTYVDSLKAQGKFDVEAQKVAFEMTYQAVIKVLSDDAKEYLTHAYGDLTVYITQMIEAEVKRNKNITTAK